VAFSFNLLQRISENDATLEQHLEFKEPITPKNLKLVLDALEENTCVRSLKVTAVVGNLITEEVVVALYDLIRRTQTLQSIDFGDIGVAQTYTPAGFAQTYTTESLIRISVLKNNSLMHFQISIPEDILKIKNHLEHNKYLARAAAFFSICELEHAIAAEEKELTTNSDSLIALLKTLRDDLKDEDQYPKDRPMPIAKLRNRLTLIATLCHKDAKKIIQDLLDFIKYLELKKTNQETALHVMAKYGFTTELEKLITECHIPVNIVDGNGRSPILTAVIHSQHATVQKLVDLKADLTLKTSVGQDAMHFAERSGDEKMKDMLRTEKSPIQKGLDSKLAESYRRVVYILGSKKLTEKFPEKATEIVQYASTGSPAQTEEIFKVHLRRYLDQRRYAKFGLKAEEVCAAFESIIATLDRSPAVYSMIINAPKRPVPFIMCHQSSTRQVATDAIKSLYGYQGLFLTHLGCSGHVYALYCSRKEFDCTGKEFGYELMIADRGVLSDHVADLKKEKQFQVVRKITFHHSYLDEVMRLLTDANECSPSEAAKIIFTDIPKKVEQAGFTHRSDVSAKHFKEGKCFLNLKAIIKALLTIILKPELGLAAYKDFTQKELRPGVVTDHANDMQQAFGQTCPEYVGKLVTFFASSLTAEDLYKELDALEHYTMRDPKPFELLATKLENLKAMEGKMEPEQQAVYAMNKAKCYSMICRNAEEKSSKLSDAQQSKCEANLAFVNIVEGNSDLLNKDMIKNRLPYAYQELASYYKGQFDSLLKKFDSISIIIEAVQIDSVLSNLHSYLKYHKKALESVRLLPIERQTGMKVVLDRDHYHDHQLADIRKKFQEARTRGVLTL